MNVLDPVVHSRLIAGMPDIVERSGVSKYWMEHSAAPVLRPGELLWLRDFRERGHPGIRISGDNSLVRCMAMAGALIRNFIDARVITLEQLMDDPEFTASVVLCPNFFVSATVKAIPAWKIQKLYERVLRQIQSGGSMVLWVESDKGLAEYGNAMADVLQQFVRVD